MADRPEQQLTQDEMAVVSAIRRVKDDGGHGEIKVTIHRSQVTDIVRSQRDKIHVDAA